jgi:hypothetical protein
VDYYDDSVILTLVPVRIELRDAETTSEDEAIERWLDDGGASEKMSAYDDTALSSIKEESTCRRRRLHMTTKHYRQFKKRAHDDRSRTA